MMEKLFKKFSPKANSLLPGKINKRKIIFLSVLFLVLSIGLITPYFARAGVGATLISWIVMPIVSLIGKLIGSLITILIKVAQYNDFIGSAAVSKGWIILRDICNMFFVAILLVIAFGTVLGVEKYSYRKLLGGFVFAAIVVNFSKLICGVIIDFSQVIMLTFINACKATAGGNFTTMLGLDQVLQMDAEGEISGGDTAGVLILALIMTVIALVVVVAILVIISFRIVILWFLVLLSPIAFIASIVPFLNKYSSKWWEKFTSQVIIGPVLAFFLWLSLSVVQGASGNMNKEVGGAGETEIIGTTSGEQNATISEAGKPENILNFIISIAMLIGSLMVAQESGAVGAKFAGSALTKIQGFADGAKKMPGKAMKGLYKANVAPRVQAYKEKMETGGKMSQFVYKHLTKDGRAGIANETLMKERWNRQGLDKDQIKQRMTISKSAKLAKTQEEQYSTAESRKKAFEKLKQEKKADSLQGLTLARSMASNDELKEEDYSFYGKAAIGGEYTENSLRELVKPKNKIMGMARTNRPEERKKIANIVNTSRGYEVAGMSSKADVEMRIDDDGNYVSSQRAADLFLGLDETNFNDFKQGEKKIVVKKMGLMAKNFEKNEQGAMAAYGMTKEEAESFKKKHSTFYKKIKGEGGEGVAAVEDINKNIDLAEDTQNKKIAEKVESKNKQSDQYKEIIGLASKTSSSELGRAITKVEQEIAGLANKTPEEQKNEVDRTIDGFTGTALTLNAFNAPSSIYDPTNGRRLTEQEAVVEFTKKQKESFHNITKSVKEKAANKIKATEDPAEVARLEKERDDEVTRLSQEFLKNFLEDFKIVAKTKSSISDFSADFVSEMGKILKEVNNLENQANNKDLSAQEISMKAGQIRGKIKNSYQRQKKQTKGFGGERRELGLIFEKIKRGTTVMLKEIQENPTPDGFKKASTAITTFNDLNNIITKINNNPETAGEAYHNPQDTENPNSTTGLTNLAQLKEIIENYWKDNADPGIIKKMLTELEQLLKNLDKNKKV